MITCCFIATHIQNDVSPKQWLQETTLYLEARLSGTAFIEPDISKLFFCEDNVCSVEVVDIFIVPL